MFRKNGMTRCHGQFFAPAKTAFPPSVAVMAKSGDVQEERLIFAPAKSAFPTSMWVVRNFVPDKFQVPTSVQAIARCHGQFFAPAKTAFPPSVTVMAKSGDVQDERRCSSAL